MYNNNTANQEEGKVSGYNSASFKMKRLHDAFSLMNKVTINLLAYNEEFDQFNYSIKFSLCQVLHLEVESKCKTDEKVKLNQYKEAIEYFFDNYDIVKIDKNNKKKLNINYDSSKYHILRKYLFDYECYIRSMIDEHGMDTRYYDEDDDPY